MAELSIVCMLFKPTLAGSLSIPPPSERPERTCRRAAPWPRCHPELCCPVNPACNVPLIGYGRSFIGIGPVSRAAPRGYPAWFSTRIHALSKTYASFSPLVCRGRMRASTCFAICSARASLRDDALGQYVSPRGARAGPVAMEAFRSQGVTLAGRVIGYQPILPSSAVESSLAPEQAIWQAKRQRRRAFSTPFVVVDAARYGRSPGTVCRVKRVKSPIARCIESKADVPVEIMPCMARTRFWA